MKKKILEQNSIDVARVRGQAFDVGRKTSVDEGHIPKSDVANECGCVVGVPNYWRGAVAAYACHAFDNNIAMVKVVMVMGCEINWSKGDWR